MKYKLITLSTLITGEWPWEVKSSRPSSRSKWRPDLFKAKATILSSSRRGQPWRIPSLYLGLSKEQVSRPKPFERQWWSLNTVVSSWDSQDMFSCLGLGSVSTLVCLVLARVLSFHVSSCLMSCDCVLSVSLSGIAKCLLCAETLAFLAERRPLGPSTDCLWSLYVIWQTIIFLACGFYVSSSFFFSSPNLSGRRLDVYHTSTRGVALVQI